MIFKPTDHLPLKYLLDIQANLPSYPTSQDFLFDVISYLVRVAESKSKEWDSDLIKFSTKTLKYVFGEKLTPEFLDKLKLIMRDLIQDGTLVKNGEYLIINQSAFNRFYTILQPD
jgi:hypothetical protein